MGNSADHIDVNYSDVSARIKFDRIFKEYLFHKMRYDRGVYGTAVARLDLVGIRITCRLLWQDLHNLDPVRTLKEVPNLKINP